MGETVNTVSGEIRHTIDSEQVKDLALNGRNYIELITLIPGVAVTSLDQMAMTTGLSVSNQSINGNRTDTNHMTVDGASNLVRAATPARSTMSAWISFNRSACKRRPSLPNTVEIRAPISTW